MGAENQSSAKSKALKLKEIALSTSNTGSERMRAIDLLGQLNNDVYDELADIVANGHSRDERINALEMLAKVTKQIHTEQPKVTPEQTETVAKVEKSVKTIRHVKPKRVEKTEYKITSNGDLPEELFNEMLYYVKPLLKPDVSCSESQIKRQFRNLKGSVVETFLTKAIKKGLIKEVTPGMFKLIARK